ncbi:hypothetical protein CGCA056_v007211 [Colletotrichum aenigma]|uniref:uncharacterized protein n=1 Tax=Colletotrichum aenigma TaxID=1215731 RepID=UPI0018729772|nr:uncharacterized protein CGCA056_v007211 [Colletotrichum aenigma]KAF5522130.1 hypothetical protein CGCA056_v007211 [Colletotrichum aenigma]
MKASAVIVPVALMIAQPAQASIGRAGGLAADFFGGGIAELFTEVFGKRSGFVTTVRSRQVEGVPEFEYQRCRDDISGLTITATAPSATEIQFSGVPPTCMNLANVLVGDGTGPFALPCGSDCLSYSNLTPEQYNQLADALRPYA